MTDLHEFPDIPEDMSLKKLGRMNDLPSVEAVGARVHMTSNTYCPHKDCPDRHKPHFHVEKEHTHKYTVAVEWEYCWKYGERHQFDETPSGKRVTKLRCESCESEISRG